MIAAANEARQRGWVAIELYGVGPDDKCHCAKGRTKEGCPSAGKHPRVTKWQDSPPMSGADVEEIWRARPRANLGIATGETSGFWVLDIDPDHGGMESAQTLGKAHGGFGQVRVVRTGSGGFHYYFRMPDFPVTNARGKLGETVDDGAGGRRAVYPGIDVRGTGGQVVAAPSRTDKGTYTVVHDFPPGIAPDWLLDMIRPDPNTPERAAVPEPTPPAAPNDLVSSSQPAAPVAESDLDRLARYVASARDQVKNYLGDRSQVDPNGWNNSTFEQACKLIELANAEWTAYSLEDARRDLFSWAPKDDGFTTTNIGTCWGSAIRKVGGKARLKPTGSSAAHDDFSDWGPDVVTPPALQKVLDQAKAGDTPVAVDMRLRPQDDIGNAERLHDRYADRLRWIEQRGRYAFYEAGRWMIDDGRYVHNLAQKLMRELRKEALHYSNIPEEGEKTSERQAFLKWVKTQAMSARVEAALKELRAQDGIPAKLTDFDAHPMLLNCTNGVVDLTTGKLLPHDPALMLMLQVPAAYDPTAQAPMWEQFLAECLPSLDMRAYLQRVVGYSLTGSMAEQALFIHHGSGANGKSVFLQVMTGIAGDYGQVVPRSTLLVKDREGHPTDIARMVGKRLLQTSETAAGRRLDEEVVKGLTGGEQQTARHMREEFFDFTPQGKIHYVTNHLPRLTDAESIWRRLHLIRWGVVIPEHAQVKNLAEQILAQEAAGVLAWAVRGALGWQELGGLLKPLESLQDLAQYRGDQDEFGDFVATALVTTKNDADRTSTKELYDAYQTWCFQSGVKHVMHLQDFGRVMRERKFKPYRTSETRGYAGVVIRGSVTAPSHPEADIDGMFR